MEPLKSIDVANLALKKFKKLFGAAFNIWRHNWGDGIALAYAIPTWMAKVGKHNLRAPARAVWNIEKEPAD